MLTEIVNTPALSGSALYILYGKAISGLNGSALHFSRTFSPNVANCHLNTRVNCFHALGRNSYADHFKIFIWFCFVNFPFLIRAVE